MSDLVRREDVVEALYQAIRTTLPGTFADSMSLAIAMANNLPSVEPERKKGEWIKEYWNGEHTRKCSACNITQTVTTYRGKVNFNFCPMCGADMKGEHE